MVRIFEKTGIRKHRNSKTWNFEYFGPQNLVGSIFIVFKGHDLTQNFDAADSTGIDSYSFDQKHIWIHL